MGIHLNGERERKRLISVMKDGLFNEEAGIHHMENGTCENASLNEGPFSPSLLASAIGRDRPAMVLLIRLTFNER